MSEPALMAHLPKKCHQPGTKCSSAGDCNLSFKPPQKGSHFLFTIASPFLLFLGQAGAVPDTCLYCFLFKFKLSCVPAWPPAPCVPEGCWILLPAPSGCWGYSCTTPGLSSALEHPTQKAVCGGAPSVGQEVGAPRASQRGACCWWFLCVHTWEHPSLRDGWAKDLPKTL